MSGTVQVQIWAWCLSVAHVLWSVTAWTRVRYLVQRQRDHGGWSRHHTESAERWGGRVTGKIVQMMHCGRKFRAFSAAIFAYFTNWCPPLDLYTNRWWEKRILELMEILAFGFSLYVLCVCMVIPLDWLGWKETNLGRNWNLWNRNCPCMSFVFALRLACIRLASWESWRKCKFVELQFSLYVLCISIVIPLY